MFLENSFPWLLVAITIINTSKGTLTPQSSGVILQNTDGYVTSQAYGDTPRKRDDEVFHEDLEDPHTGRIKRDAEFQGKEDTDETSPSNGDDPIFDKRRMGGKPSKAMYETPKTSVGWLPWHDAIGPVRRSFFVPRLGKRDNWKENDDTLAPASELKSSNELSEEVSGITPAEEEYIQNSLNEIHGINEVYNDDNSFYPNEPFEFNEDSDLPLLGQDVIFDEEETTPFNSRSNRVPMTFAPRLGKKAYSFAPRLGKKAYSFAPRLGKKSFSFAPRLGKKSYSFAPRLGKKSYSFAPRLGKKSYSFAPRLGKKSYTFAPRLGKRPHSFVPRLGKRSFSFTPRLGK